MLSSKVQELIVIGLFKTHKFPELFLYFLLFPGFFIQFLLNLFLLDFTSHVIFFEIQHRISLLKVFH